MSIEREIAAARKKVVTDGYDMSIGELVGLFERSELEITPAYQRLFRWEDSQKTRFIESLLLGIPTPPIFVATREDGTWELVDGLQRISTLLEFFGDLSDENGRKRPPLSLEGTELIPSLDETNWSQLSNQLKLDLKRVRVRVEILKRESDSDTKYELFQRLNTGGTKLEPQEVRNCVMIMLDPRFYEWFEALSQDQNFKKTTNLSDAKNKSKYDMELVLRFLALRHFPYTKGRDVHDYLDEAARKLPKLIPNRKAEKSIFEQTFETFSNSGNSAFRVKYKSPQFSLASFEVLSVGLAAALEKKSLSRSMALQVLATAEKKLWSSSDFKKYSGMGVRGSDRLQHLGSSAARFFGK